MTVTLEADNGRPTTSAEVTLLSKEYHLAEDGSRTLVGQNYEAQVLVKTGGRPWPLLRWSSKATAGALHRCGVNSHGLNHPHGMSEEWKRKIHAAICKAAGLEVA